MGYVGLPLAFATAAAGFETIGFDNDESKLPKLNSGQSYIEAVSSKELLTLVLSGKFRATSNMLEMEQCDIIVICVPTPLTVQREPDMQYIIKTAKTIAKVLRQGQTVILESTTYPGTTVGLVKPILEKTDLRSGEDFFLGFSPEREDPGNKNFDTVSIPKIVSGEGEDAKQIVIDFYSKIIKEVVPVSTPDTAEAVKITENIFRTVNIALVNELKVIYDAMGIDIWEVVDAAKTKPFGYMPFYPGPGLGGHCIPIDPFYLTWKAREYEVPTRFIELAGEINTYMPHYVIRRLERVLDTQAGLSISKAEILILGVAYKKNIPDVRESPAWRIIELVQERGGKWDYYDPFVEELPITRQHSELSCKKSIELSPSVVSKYDVVIVVTDHDDVDYEMISSNVKLVLDTRNVMYKNGLIDDHIYKS